MNQRKNRVIAFTLAFLLIAGIILVYAAKLAFAASSLDINITYTNLVETQNADGSIKYAWSEDPVTKTNQTCTVTRTKLNGETEIKPPSFKISVTGAGWTGEELKLTVICDQQADPIYDKDPVLNTDINIEGVTPYLNSAQYTITAATDSGMTQTVIVNVKYIATNATAEWHWDRKEFVVTSIDSIPIEKEEVGLKSEASRTIEAPQGSITSAGYKRLGELVSMPGCSDPDKLSHKIEGYWYVTCWYSNTPATRLDYSLRDYKTIADSPSSVIDPNSVNSFANWSTEAQSTFDALDPFQMSYEGICAGTVDTIIQDDTGASIPGYPSHSDQIWYPPNQLYAYTVNYPGAIAGYTFLYGQVNGELLHDTKTSRKITYSSTTKTGTIKWVYKKDNPETNLPPIPIIDLPTTCVAGDTVRLSGERSYDTDGTIVNYTWGLQGSPTDMEGKSLGFITFPSPGDFLIMLDVTDDDGATSSTSVRITVTARPPIAKYTVGGKLKENRKVIMDGSASKPGSYPIDWSKTQWTVTAVSGGTNTDADISFLQPTAGQVNISGLLRKQGKYAVRLKIEDTNGATAVYDDVVTIAPDLAPIAMGTVDAQATRNPSDSNMATITVTNQSYSPDNDPCSTVCLDTFDSDNDENYLEETAMYSTDGTTWASTGMTLEQALRLFNFRGVAKSNPAKFTVKTNQVGKHQFDLVPVEAIPLSDTIASLLKGTEAMLGSPLHLLEDTVNVPPVTDLKAGKVSNVDLVVATDYTGASLSALNTRLSSFISECYAKKINVNVKVVDAKKYAGRYIVPGSSGMNAAESTSTPYTVADWRGLLEYGDGSYSVTQTSQGTITPQSITTNSAFGSKLKQVTTVRTGNSDGRIFLTENGNVYTIGTFSRANIGSYPGEGVYVYTPQLVLTGIKQLADTKTGLTYALGHNGNVYALGNIPSWNTGSDGDNHVRIYQNFNTASTDYRGNGVVGPSQSYVTGGYWGASQVNNLSNITYIKAFSTAILARDSSGNWYGMGGYLNNFGLATGFMGVMTGTENLWGGDSFTARLGSWTTQTTTWYDNVNSITYLANLSNLDKSIGGIIDIGPNKAIATNGNVYTFKETSTKSYWPFQATGSSFAVNYSSWVDPTTITNPVVASTAAESYTSTVSLADYDSKSVPISQYTSYVSFPMSGLETFYTKGSVNQPMQLGSKVCGFAPQMSYKAGVNEVHSFAYIKDYTSLVSEYYEPNYSYTVTYFIPPSRWDTRTYYGGWVHTFSYSIRPKVIPDENAPHTIGWKAYCADLNGVLSTTFRPNSARYVLYVEEGDSFFQVPTSISSFVTSNNCNTRVSCDASVVDRPTNNPSYINLRQFLNASSNGKLYGKGALESMLADIANENAVSQASNVLYSIVGEETIAYTKSYTDYENDPQQGERFMYEHNPNYFENNSGVATFHGQWFGTPITQFDKVGEYLVSYQGQDKATALVPFLPYNKWSKDTRQLKIYVHRRPIAKYIPSGGSRTAGGIPLSIIDKSYDLDHGSMQSRGLVAHEWKYRYVGQSDWINGIPSFLEDGKPFDLWLRVQDLEGAWSYPYIQRIDPNIRSYPVAQYTIRQNPLELFEKLNLKDTSYTPKGSLTHWHWTIYKLGEDGQLSGKIQDGKFTTHNNGSGDLTGYDQNVQTDYSVLGEGTYRIFLRVRNTEGLWSDGEGDGNIDLNACYYKDLVVKNSMMLMNFRISMIRDLGLEGFYRSTGGSKGKYRDIDMDVNLMGIDGSTFAGKKGVSEKFKGLTKGYTFEFKIDSIGLNGPEDSVRITPSFYTISEAGVRNPTAVDLYWKDSQGRFFKAGEGGHLKWKSVELKECNRRSLGENKAEWRGSYLIPGTAFAVPKGTTPEEAKTLFFSYRYVKEDILVSFQIDGCKRGVSKFDYNLRQWQLERINKKVPYLVGDVIRYDWRSNCLFHVKTRRIF